MSALYQPAECTGKAIGEQQIAVILVDGIAWCSALPMTPQAADKINAVAKLIVERTAIVESDFA